MTRAGVDAFHRIALANGGNEDSAPALRPEYHAHCCTAFVLNPNANKIEAVTFAAS
jgi:hypothetical protein